MSTAPLVPPELDAGHIVLCLDCKRRFPTYPAYASHYCEDRDTAPSGVAFK